MRWSTVVWLGLTACSAAAPDDKSGGTDNLGGDADTDTDTDSDTDADSDADTDPTTPPTGCYDVPLTVSGGYAPPNTPFAPLADGDPIPMTHGPQGGWHIETAVSVDATHDTVKVLPTVTVVATGQVISGAGGESDANRALVVLTMDPSGDCAGEAVGLRAYLDDVIPETESEVDICPLSGAEVLLSWEVTDLSDLRVGQASVTGFLQLDPMDIAPCDAL